MLIARRGFIAGVLALVAAPAIVRATSIMPLSVLPRRLTDIELWRRGVDPNNLLANGRPVRRLYEPIPPGLRTNANKALAELMARQPDEPVEVVSWIETPNGCSPPIDPGHLGLGHYPPIAFDDRDGIGFVAYDYTRMSRKLPWWA